MRGVWLCNSWLQSQVGVSYPPPKCDGQSGSLPTPLVRRRRRGTTGLCARGIPPPRARAADGLRAAGAGPPRDVHRRDRRAPGPDGHGGLQRGGFDAPPTSCASRRRAMAPARAAHDGHALPDPDALRGAGDPGDVGVPDPGSRQRAGAPRQGTSGRFPSSRERRTWTSPATRASSASSESASTQSGLSCTSTFASGATSGWTRAGRAKRAASADPPRRRAAKRRGRPPPRRESPPAFGLATDVDVALRATAPTSDEGEEDEDEQ